MGNWSSVTLNKVLSFSNGKSSPYRAENLPYPVYGSNGIIGFANETNASSDTIVIGRVGSYCGSLYYSAQKCWVTDNAIKANAIDGNDGKFLFYVLLGLNLNSLRVGSGQPLLNQSILGDVLVSIPGHDEQRAIAAILGALDDKIELNRKMNETLEEMARAIFKSWFVDFDPVRAKMEGRNPGLPKEIADLFPNSLQDSELGQIPKGWRVGSIYEVANIVYGAPFKSELFNNERKGLPVIRIRDLKTSEPDFWTEEQHPKATVIEAGDILAGMDAEFRAYMWIGQKALLNQRVMLIKPAEEYISEFFLKEAISPLLEDEERAQVGTTVAHLGKKDIDKFRVLIPPIYLLKEFSGYAKVLIEKQINIAGQSLTLAATRDALLPKLISGEIRIKDAEKFVEGAIC